MVIAIDFDGTCVRHEFPRIGADIGAVPILKELVAKGHKLILYTMRSHKSYVKYGSAPVIDNSNSVLSDAISWFTENGIILWAVNNNPTQRTWTNSPKAYANHYIDDAAIGCPTLDDNGLSRPYVDWIEMRKLLIQLKIL